MIHTLFCCSQYLGLNSFLHWETSTTLTERGSPSASTKQETESQECHCLLPCRMGSRDGKSALLKPQLIFPFLFTQSRLGTVSKVFCWEATLAMSFGQKEQTFLEQFLSVLLGISGLVVPGDLHKVYGKIKKLGEFTSVLYLKYGESWQPTTFSLVFRVVLFVVLSLWFCF